MRLRWRRMRLRRDDGKIYLDRWGFELVPGSEPDERPREWFGIFVHRMTAPDPGLDLHDHPWWFATIPIVGSYVEERAMTREAPALARDAEMVADQWHVEYVSRGNRQHVRRGRWRGMRLDECHRITDLSGPRVWTVVVHGPKRRRWGFYEPDGYAGEGEYESTHRRPVANDMGLER